MAHSPTLIPSPVKPVIKWAGGKTQLLPQILSRLPEQFSYFHEPFLGGAAVFLGLSPQKAILSDTNANLIRLYETIRDDHEALHRELEVLESYYNSLSPDKQANLFYDGRAEFNGHPASAVRSSVLFLLLNKAGFNGLYRENSKGEFNVPFGRRRQLNLPTLDHLKACSDAFNHSELIVDSFESIVDRAEPGDFVYFDPPYVPLTADSSFTSYQAGGFGLEEQKLLSSIFSVLADRGVFVMLSNSHTSTVMSLYDGFRIEVVEARRNINSKGSGRGAVEEVLVRNY